MDILKTDDAGNPVELVTPIITMERKSAGNTVRVDLIAAVHFAEQDYYEALNRRFTRYQVILVPGADRRLSGKEGGKTLTRRYS